MNHRLVPSFITTRFAAGQFSGDFHAFGLFLDISGFSAMTDALLEVGQQGAETLAQIMCAVLDPLIEGLFAQGGFVASSAGDALTALFEAGPDEKHAASRALAAAWSIQQTMQAHAEYTAAGRTFRVSAKVGLAEGDVNWGILQSGSSKRGVFYFQGSAVDGCSEAEHNAAAGDIIIDANLLGLLASQVQAEPAGDFFRVLNVAGPLPQSMPLNIPPPDMPSSALFFPQDLLAQSISGEFRQVVNLFIGLPSVRTKNQLRIFVESLFALQEKYGGLLNRLDFGDKGTNLLLFWGAPAAYENDIERALNFILDLQTATSIPIRAGVTYRMSHAGFIGSPLHEEYTCSGRGVNLAARLMMAAPRDEIWVDEWIAERASSQFKIEFIQEKVFKGFQQAQKVFTLLERKEEQQPFNQSPLAGRDPVLQDLDHFVAPVWSGKYAGMLVVTGEPGIGKSRLVNSFVLSLEAHAEERFQTFTCITDEVLRQPFNPLVYGLRRYFGLSETQVEAREKRAFNRKLDKLIAAVPHQNLADELDRTRSFLGALVGLAWPDSLYEQLDAPGRYKNTLIALTVLLQAESLCSPLLFVLEDIQWLDSDSRAFLKELLRILALQEDQAYPIAILATSRVHAGRLELEGLDLREVELQGLVRSSLETLAAGMLGSPPNASLLDLLEARAEGNPFYAEQILRYLKAEGFLQRSDGSWNILPNQERILPADVNALLVARLDHLAREVKNVVQTAAVLGREFEVNLLNGMLHPGEDRPLPPEVYTAENEAIWKALNEMRYIFRHALLREAAYQMQVTARRKALHSLALDAYEKCYADNLPDHYGELAYHAEQSGRQQSARDYLRLAGDSAKDAYLNLQAVDYYTRALAITPETDLNAHVALLSDRGWILYRMGDNAGWRRDINALEKLLSQLTDPEKIAEIRLSQAYFALNSGFYPQADSLAAQAQAFFASAGILEKEAHAVLVRASTAFRQGLFPQMVSKAEEGLRLARQAQAVELEIRAMNTIGLAKNNLGKLEEAAEIYHQCLEISTRSEKIMLQGAILNNLGKIAGSQGNFMDALHYFDQARALAVKTGDRADEGVYLGNLGFIESNLGDFQKARTYIEGSIRISREINNRYLETYGLINLSACEGYLGNYQSAGRIATEARELACQDGDRSGEAWALSQLGHSLLAMRDIAPAMTAYSEALLIRQELGQPDLASEPAAGQARAALEMGDVRAARQHLELVLQHLDGGGSLDGTDEPLRVYQICYLVLTQTGDPRNAELLETAYRLLQNRAEKIPEEKLRRAYLENIPHHREIVRAWESSRG